MTQAVRGITIVCTETCSLWQRPRGRRSSKGKVGRVSVDPICTGIWNQCSSFTVKILFFPECKGREEFHNLLALQYSVFCISKIILKLIEFYR